MVDNIQLVPDTQFVGDNVKIACLPGHEYNDSSIEKFSDCQANQTWSYIPFSCIRKYLNVYKKFYIWINQVLSIPDT